MTCAIFGLESLRGEVSVTTQLRQVIFVFILTGHSDRSSRPRISDCHLHAVYRDVRNKNW